MVRIEDFEDEKTDGLYPKYRVFKEPEEANEHPVSIEASWSSRAIGEGSMKHGKLDEVASFIFPLKPDTDSHARVALAAYAWSIRDEKPHLSADLLDLLDDIA